MSTVTVTVTQRIAIVRTTTTADPAEVSQTVADVIQRDLIPANGIDWTTFGVAVDAPAGA